MSKTFHLMINTGGVTEPVESESVAVFADRQDAYDALRERENRTHGSYWVAVCEDDEIEADEEDTECRSCGEIEPCGEMGLCEICASRYRYL